MLSLKYKIAKEADVTNKLAYTVARIQIIKEECASLIQSSRAYKNSPELAYGDSYSRLLKRSK